MSRVVESGDHWRRRWGVVEGGVSVVGWVVLRVVETTAPSQETRKWCDNGDDPMKKRVQKMTRDPKEEAQS